MLNFVKLTAAVLLDKARSIVNSMTGNATYPTPSPALNTITAAADALETAMAEAGDKSRVKLAAVREKKLALVDLLRALANYVTYTAAGNEERILSSGFDVTRNRSNAPVPEMVQDVEAIFTNTTGQIKLRWKKSRFARLYEVYMTTTPDVADSWVLVDSVAGRKLIVQNLASKTRYYFKITAVGTAGNADSSDVSAQIAA